MLLGNSNNTNVETKKEKKKSEHKKEPRVDKEKKKEKEKEKEKPEVHEEENKEIKEESVQKEEPKEPELQKELIQEVKEEKKQVLESSEKQEITLQGKKEVPTKQITFTTSAHNPKNIKEKEEPKIEEEIHEEKEIIEEKSDKEEIKTEKKTTNNAPNQPFWTFMSLNPNIPVCGDDKKDDKPSMAYMIPVYCVDPRSFPNGVPTMPPMTNMPFPFFPFYGMNMPQNDQNK